jgi:hypothetical protein
MQIIEFKRKCNECGKVWHSLKSREEKIAKDLAHSSSMSGSFLTCCGDSATVSQYKRNKLAEQDSLEKLKSCPHCGSHNYTETELVLDENKEG